MICDCGRGRMPSHGGCQPTYLVLSFPSGTTLPLSPQGLQPHRTSWILGKCRLNKSSTLEVGLISNILSMILLHLKRKRNDLKENMYEAHLCLWDFSSSSKWGDNARWQELWTECKKQAFHCCSPLSFLLLSQSCYVGFSSEKRSLEIAQAESFPLSLVITECNSDSHYWKQTAQTEKVFFNHSSQCSSKKKVNNNVQM